MASTVNGLNACLAVVNANVWTLDDRNPRTSAFLIEQGKITVVGSADEVLRAGPGAPLLDCGGATVLPGFVDGHCHFELTCLTTDYWINVHTPPHASLESIATAIREKLDDRPGTDWILCRSSFAMQDKVAEGRLFTRQDLDAISSDRPLAVFASLHVASLNTRALENLELWDIGSNHAFHGLVHRDEAGLPTGVVTEVFMMVPSSGSDSEFEQAITRHARDLFNAAGTTMVNTMPESLKQVDLQRQLHLENRISIRQKYYLISPGVATLDEAEHVSQAVSIPGRFEFGGIKVFVNGCGHDGLGVAYEDLKWTQDSLDSFVIDADRRGFQVWLHSLTAHGVRMAARAILRAAPLGNNPRRHRIEHGADFIDLADLDLIRDSGALLVTTPQFLHSMTTDPTGPTAPLRSLIAAGVRIVGGTDSTGTVPSSVSILRNVDTAVRRRRSDGSAFHANESIDVFSALKLFTVGSSYGTFSEDLAGRIAVGAFGDFVLLTRDLFAEGFQGVDDVAVQSTYLGGARVWQEE